MDDTPRRQPSYPVSDTDKRRAKIPHELFLTNLIGNHILVFVALLGMASHNPGPVFVVPAISLAVLTYTIWRARRSRSSESWYVMCHWQVAERRSRVFILMLALLGIASLVAWYGYDALGVRKEAALAIVGGVGMLPTLVTVLVLIIMESEVLHQAAHGRVPRSMVRRHPPPAELAGDDN